MRIERLIVENFLGITRADVSLRAPVALFCGANGAGKSSLRDAISLALTADLGRVGQKKETPALIRDGADLAVCELITSDGDSYRVSINGAGKVTDSRKGTEPDPVLPYVLDAQRLARMSDTERRAFFFGLMGLKTDPAAVRQRLVARVFAGRQPTADEAGRIERVAPMLRAGFDAAHKDAKTRATEAKGSWRAVAGEVWGSEKGKTWKAHVPPYDARAAQDLATEIKHADVALEGWQRQVGALQAEEQRRAGLRARLPALQEHAGKIARLQTKQLHDEAALKDAAAALQQAQGAAGAGPRVGLVHELAKALHGVALEPRIVALLDLDTINAALSAYEREHGSLTATGGDPEARARMPELQRQHALMISAVEHAKRDLAAAQRAKAEADGITAELAVAFDAAGLADASEQADKLKLQRAELVKRADALKTVKAVVEAAEAKTTQAARHHADVVAWDAIADALGPDGIPGEMLAEALGPINERLAQSALDTEWPRVEITADMQIRTGLHEREYRLLSESEKWRADAMLAEAVAHLSGERLLVLDRFDVLDLHGRQGLLSWLDALADAGEIDTALVFGTLKAAPTGLPPTIEAHWIDAGMCVAAQAVELAEAA